MQFFLFIILAYLLGSIPFGKLVGRKYGIDIQKKGSGNIGFTNSLRSFGLKPAILVLFADILKGFIPVNIALSFFPQNQILIIAIAAILGHIFPVWLKFKGGKGVATGFGAIVAINPIISLIPIAVFALVFLIKRIVSVSSILATGSLMLVSYFISPNLTLFYLFLFAIILWTHRENISRLIKGTEKRL
jgi:acyl phosphate:glycerol-3-phosphate acyltransferase